MPAPDPLRSKNTGDNLAMAVALRSVRRRSDYVYLGMPLWCIAVGPDLARGETRGHAKGLLAVHPLLHMSHKDLWQLNLLETG